LWLPKGGHKGRPYITSPISFCNELAMILPPNMLAKTHAA
jgi:hypothetical protein